MFLRSLRRYSHILDSILLPIFTYLSTASPGHWTLSLFWNLHPLRQWSLCQVYMWWCKGFGGGGGNRWVATVRQEKRTQRDIQVSLFLEPAGHLPFAESHWLSLVISPYGSGWSLPGSYNPTPTIPKPQNSSVSVPRNTKKIWKDNTKETKPFTTITTGRKVLVHIILIFLNLTLAQLKNHS